MINNTYFTSNISLKNINSLPTNMSYFFEGDFTEFLNLEETIDNITSVISFIDITDYKLEKYNKSNSYSGLSLPTNKLIVELNLSRHVKYTTTNKISTSSMINLPNLSKVITIGIPNKICNVSIEDVIRRGELTITPYIENVFFKKINDKSVLISISAAINVKF